MGRLPTAIDIPTKHSDPVVSGGIGQIASADKGCVPARLQAGRGTEIRQTRALGDEQPRVVRQPLALKCHCQHCEGIVLRDIAVAVDIGGQALKGCRRCVLR